MSSARDLAKLASALQYMSADPAPSEAPSFASFLWQAYESREQSRHSFTGFDGITMKDAENHTEP